MIVYCNKWNIIQYLFYYCVPLPLGRMGVQISQPSPYVVRIGQRVSFECTASDPGASVYWQYPDARRAVSAETTRVCST